MNSKLRIPLCWKDNLGKITVNSYQNSGAIRTLPNGVKVLDRSLQIAPQYQPVTPVDIRIYFSQAELDALMSSDPSLTGIESLNISKFSSGCGEIPTGYSYIAAGTSGKIDSFYYVQFSTAGFSDFYIRGGTDPALAVSFVSLGAKRVGQHVQVNWQTASESKNRGFEIQYSVDGVSFRNVGFVTSKASGGNSNTILSYSFYHFGASNASGYYRLRQEDTDGKSVFSGTAFVKAISGKKMEFIRFYPNPAKQTLYFEITAASKVRANIIVSGADGRVAKQLQQELFLGNNKITIPLNGLQAGIYLISVKDADGNRVYTNKLIKQ